MREHAGLSLRRARTVASHGGKEKWPHSARRPVIDDSTRDYGDIRDAPAAHADGDTRTRAQVWREAARFHFVVYGARDIVEFPVWKVLADGDEHAATIINTVNGEVQMLDFYKSES